MSKEQHELEKLTDPKAAPKEIDLNVSSLQCFFVTILVCINIGEKSSSQ